MAASLYVYSLLLLSYVVINVVIAIESTPPNPKTKGQPWPMPHIYATTGDTLELSSSMFKFVATNKNCDILQDAFNRYFSYIFVAGKARFQYEKLRFIPQESRLMLTTLKVDVGDECQGLYPSLDMDESYDLKILGDPATLTAVSVWGALRGLETFSQLVYEDINDRFVVNITKIQDKPRFSWRGVLLDTSRHYLAKEIILQNLEAMAFNKMNVFHWHIVDDQSFPYQSKAYPELSNKGAYDPYTHVYSPSDVQDIIEFARRRGIRVVPEFDSPGHTQSWGNGQADLLTKCYNGEKATGRFGPIDPTVNSTYDFLNGFIKELTEVFPDKYLHLGGDEVLFSCWKSNPYITHFMEQHGFGTNYAKLEEYYMQKLLDIVSSYNSGYVIWQEVVDNGVKVAMDTVVEVWKGHQEKELEKVTSAGFRSILSSCWYLNRIAFGSDWKNHYKCDPHHFNGTEAQKKLVVGGELCMWGEFVDGTNLISRTWPRGSAVAERLWSSADMRDPQQATPRLEEHRCRMIRRGLNAEPVNGPGVCKYEYRPHLFSKVDKTTIVEVWRYPFKSELYNMTKSGYQVILSAPWYLDYVSYGALWKKYYVVEPLKFNGSVAQEALVKGGEACLWGEYVDNTNVESRLWPSASAIAERLWSPLVVNNVTEAQPRMEEHRCRMIRRGINAKPPSGPGYCQYEASAYITQLKNKWK